jgi:hypothetical protein
MPYIPESFKCEACETIKGVANHWRVVFAYPDRISIHAFDSHLAKESGALIFCGEAHVLNLVSEKLSQLEAL